MKINEVEQLLGITKANIRFYEKEGLLTPSRTDRGYRDYDENDIARLKTIVILRKLGIPVQQIQEVLDGCVPLQEAIDQNIRSLTTQIDALNGALTLSRQIQRENMEVMDIEHYWDLINNQESMGFQFQSLVDDYLIFTEINYEWLLFPIPVESLRKPWTLLLYILGYSTLTAFAKAFLGNAFFPALLIQFVGIIVVLILWTVIFMPIYLLSKQKPKLAKSIMDFIFFAAPIAMIIIVCLVFYFSASR